MSYTGTFSGTSALHGILIFHADGSANAHDVETFTGTVNGVPGTVTSRRARLRLRTVSRRPTR